LPAASPAQERHPAIRQRNDRRGEVLADHRGPGGAIVRRRNHDKSRLAQRGGDHAAFLSVAVDNEDGWSATRHRAPAFNHRSS